MKLLVLQVEENKQLTLVPNSAEVGMIGDVLILEKHYFEKKS